MTTSKTAGTGLFFVNTFFLLFFCVCLCSPEFAAAKNSSYEVLVHTDDAATTVEYFKSKNFWGKTSHEKDLDVPRIILVVTSGDWGKVSKIIPVPEKKELFYRTIIPMVLLANELILEERKNIETFDETLKKGKFLTAKQQNLLQEIARQYGVEELQTEKEQTAELLERIDVIPASLALGQSAYESGYGTSRFAREGNALFGQWTYGGKGMKPKEHRAEKGNYGVASYKWPFDSVRSYMLNLNTHKSYQKLRDKRSSLRKNGKEATGIELAETLDKYSERGMEYVKTLQSIITVNGLAVADKARLLDEPFTLIVAVTGDKGKKETQEKIKQLRASNELEKIIKTMHLESDLP